jgi:hypothetical protein
MLGKVFLSVLLVAFFVPFYIAGIFFTCSGFNTIRLGREAHTWPAAPAVLESCTVEKTHAKKGDVYRATARYVYSVAGVRYTGKRVGIDTWMTGDLDKHEALCRQATTMAPFMVRYRPTDPQMALIVVPAHPWISWTFNFGVAWLTCTTIIAAALLFATGAARKIASWFR